MGYPPPSGRLALAPGARISRIALLRRAGIGLADIQRFLAAPAAAVIDRWLADLTAETGARRKALEALASTLGFGTSLSMEPAMAVIIRPVDSPAELVTAFDVAGAQFDPAIDHADQRRFTELEAAYPGERELLLVAEETGSVVGAARISLGADAEAGFYIRHGGPGPSLRSTRRLLHDQGDQRAERAGHARHGLTSPDQVTALRMARRPHSPSPTAPGKQDKPQDL